MKKRVKILTNGIIPGTTVVGPVLNPLYLDITEISGLILHGAKMVEVLSNDTEVELNMTNYLEDNEKKLIVNPEEIKKIEKKALEKINKRRSFTNNKKEEIDNIESI